MRSFLRLTGYYSHFVENFSRIATPLHYLTRKGVSFEWDDSIITDMDTELEKRLLLLQNAITSKKELRMWYFGETDRQAEEALTEIQEELANDRTNENVYQYSESFRNELNRNQNNKQQDSNSNNSNDNQNITKNKNNE